MPPQGTVWAVQRRNGVDYMEPWKYFQTFGYTRADRAEKMEQANLTLRTVPNNPGVLSAPSQARNLNGVYTVSKYRGQMRSCTCADFLRHAPYDDMFACKHMLLTPPP